VHLRRRHARKRAHLVGGQLFGGFNRLVHGRQNEVLQHVYVGRVNHLGVNFNGNQFFMTAHDHCDHAAAGTRFNGFFAQGFLSVHHLLLHGL
jgi:hypothetical protein